MTSTKPTRALAGVRLAPICAARGERQAIPPPRVMRDAPTVYPAACAHAASTRSGDQ